MSYQEYEVPDLAAFYKIQNVSHSESGEVQKNGVVSANPASNRKASVPEARFW